MIGYAGKPRRATRRTQRPRTHCSEGHELAGDNLMIIEVKRMRAGELRRYSSRRCRTCYRAYESAWRAAR